MGGEKHKPPAPIATYPLPVDVGRRRQAANEVKNVQISTRIRTRHRADILSRMVRGLRPFKDGP